MELSDSDLQAMDAVVDGHATPGEAERVSVLSVDPAVETAMLQLRSARAGRTDVFASLEPDDATLERFQWRLGGAMADVRSTERARRRAGGGWGMSRVGSAAAACVAVGFFGGWMGRGRPAVAPVINPSPVVQNDGFADPVAVNQPVADSEITVPVSNEYGQVVAFQKFHNSADATRFTEELNRANNSNVPAVDSNVKLLSGEKY